MTLNTSSVINNINLLEILDNSDFELVPKRENLTLLEQSVLNNDYDNIEKLISTGTQIFTTDKLCNGYLTRRLSCEHNKCIKNICYKTATYYSLFINYSLTRTINQVLKVLQTKDNLSEKILKKILLFLRLDAEMAGV